MTHGPALSVHGLSKRFGARLAFDDISFEIGYGEVFGFLGPNGAGKTTTVRTIPATLVIALVGAVGLVVLNGIGWWVASAAFDRERLITGA